METSRFGLRASLGAVGLSASLVSEFRANGVNTVDDMIKLQFIVLMNNPTHYKHWDEIEDLVSRCKVANLVEEGRGSRNKLGL